MRGWRRGVVCIAHISFEAYGPIQLSTGQVHMCILQMSTNGARDLNEWTRAPHFDFERGGVGFEGVQQPIPHRPVPSPPPLSASTYLPARQQIEPDPGTLSVWPGCDRPPAGCLPKPVNDRRSLWSRGI